MYIYKNPDFEFFFRRAKLRLRRAGRSLALATFTAILAYPLAYAGGAGSSAAEFLRLGYGTRALGMGETFTAVSDDAAALYYNPAGLAYPAVSQPNAGAFEATLTESLQVQDITMTQGGFVARPWGLSVTRLDYGKLEGRSQETAAPESSFGASDMAVSFSGAHRLEDYNVSVGMSARYISQTIATFHASAYAADFGVLKRMERLPVSFGASVSNLGTPVKFVSQSAPLPMTVSLGAAYGMTPKFPHALSLQIDLPRDSGPVMRLGFEYAGFGPLALRAGYRTYAGNQRAAIVGGQLGQTYSGISGFYGFFMGVGLRTKWGNLDYAMQPYGDLGLENRISINVRFGLRRPKAQKVERAEPAPERIYSSGGGGS